MLAAVEGKVGSLKTGVGVSTWAHSALSQKGD